MHDISVAILAQAVQWGFFFCSGYVRSHWCCASQHGWRLVMRHLIWLSTALVVLHTVMPHVRGIAAKRERTRRAVKLGYAPSTWKMRQQWIAVPSPLASAGGVMLQSLQRHWQHDALTNQRNHHGRVATLAAAPLLSNDELKESLALHKAAGKAKHGVSKSRFHWADVHDNSDDRDDAVFLSDPWAQHPPSSNVESTPLPRPLGSDTGSREDSQELNADAIPFVPRDHQFLTNVHTLLADVVNQNSLMLAWVGQLLSAQGHHAIAPGTWQEAHNSTDAPGVEPQDENDVFESRAEATETTSPIEKKVIESISGEVLPVVQQVCGAFAEGIVQRLTVLAERVASLESSKNEVQATVGSDSSADVQATVAPSESPGKDVQATVGKRRRKRKSKRKLQQSVAAPRERQTSLTPDVLVDTGDEAEQLSSSSRTRVILMMRRRLRNVKAPFHNRILPRLLRHLVRRRQSPRNCAASTPKAIANLVTDVGTHMEMGQRKRLKSGLPKP